MTAVNVWLKDLLPRTPGILRSVAARETRLAAREFFARSYCWRQVTTPIPTVANTAAYAPVPADAVNSEVFAILDVEYLGRTLTRLPQRPPGIAPGGDPAYWYSTVPGTCEVWPVPTAVVADALRFHVALLPKIDSANVPDFMYQRYYDALLDGALGRVYMHPSKPYSDPTKATYHLRRFRDAIGQAAGEAKAGHNNAVSWRYPSFA